MDHKTTVHINGIDLYYESYSHSCSQKTIVLIHGFLSSSFSFRKLIPYLKTEYRIISIDLPPFGKSGKARTFKYSLQNLASTLIQLLEYLHLDKVTLIGHSMGGQVALALTHLRPDLVNEVILLCSSGYLKKPKPLITIGSYLPFFHLFVKRWLERSGLENNLKLVVYNQSMIDREMEQGYLEPFLNNEIFNGLSKFIRDRDGDLPSDVLHELETPCLLIWGEQDQVVPLQIGKRLEKDLKHAKLVVLRETGHLLPEERPEIVFQFIHDFIQNRITK